jgi:type I restriction enzyme S subunit
MFKFAYGEKTIIDEVVTKPILKYIYTLENENQNLAQLRDWLLPMLMNGQVTVA